MRKAQTIPSILTILCNRDHIRQCHLIYRCSHCRTKFNTEIEKEVHISQSPMDCIPGTNSDLERDQYCDSLKWMKLKKDLRRIQNIENQWKKMYSIIFEVEEIDLSIPSPCRFKSHYAWFSA
jgi:hypothetical protein